MTFVIDDEVIDRFRRCNHRPPLVYSLHFLWLDRMEQRANDKGMTRQAGRQAGEQALWLRLPTELCRLASKFFVLQNEIQKNQIQSNPTQREQVNPVGENSRALEESQHLRATLAFLPGYRSSWASSGEEAFGGLALVHRNRLLTWTWTWTSTSTSK